MDLTPKQQAFCEYYLANPNATESAIKAGYSKKTARSQGQRMLTNVDIKNYIEKHQNTASSRRIATAEEVLEYLSDVMRSEEEHTKERTKAAELLGKRFALFISKLENEGGGAVAVQVNSFAVKIAVRFILSDYRY